jgi:hypothetical protein
MHPLLQRMQLPLRIVERERHVGVSVGRVGPPRQAQERRLSAPISAVIRPIVVGKTAGRILDCVIFRGNRRMTP